MKPIVSTGKLLIEPRFDVRRLLLVTLIPKPVNTPGIVVNNKIFGREKHERGLPLIEINLKCLHNMPY